MKKAQIAFLIGTLFGGAITPVSLFAQAPKAAKATPAASVSDADIAAAKAKGQVWCNTGTKVCHPSGDKYYGKTKAGKFVDANALPAGYRMAGASSVGKKKTASK
jgi:hypothetical protein